MKKPTIKDVAHDAGVSTATVSHVVNGTKFVGQTTRLRVLAAVDNLGYRPSGVASSLRRQSSRVIGLVLPMQDQDTSAAFFTRLAAGIEDVLSQHGYRTIISNSVEDYDREREQIGMLSGQFTDFIDGLVLAPTVDNGHHTQSPVHRVVSRRLRRQTTDAPRYRRQLRWNEQLPGHHGRYALAVRTRVSGHRMHLEPH